MIKLQYGVVMQIIALVFYTDLIADNIYLFYSFLIEILTG